MRRGWAVSTSRAAAGASPLFPPQHPTAEAATEALLHLVRRPACVAELDRPRWTLALILAACPWLKITSLGGLSQFLRRLKISYKRARAHVHSPDLHYVDKLRAIRLCIPRLVLTPERYALLFQDEVSYTRQPTLSQAYAACGADQAPAEQGHTKNRVWRITATLDALSGRVVYLQQGRITLAALVRFYQQVRQAYPHAERIYLVQDNWPVHFHPDVLAALMPQTLPYPPKLPPTWPTDPSPRARRLNLPIQLVQLPTYASWCNPIEKLWRKLRQEVLHLHRYEDDWDGLRQAVKRWLDQFATGSAALLRYVGLSDLSLLYKAVTDTVATSPPVT